MTHSKPRTAAQLRVDLAEQEADLVDILARSDLTPAERVEYEECLVITRRKRAEAGLEQQ